MGLSLKREVRYKARRPRMSTLITSAMLLPDDREIRVQIRNISPGGFMAVTEEELTVGTWLGVELPGRGIIRAQVRWFESGMLGAQFQRPLVLKEADLL